MSWQTWAKRVQAIAQTGLAYTENPYDRERYEQLRALAVEVAEAHLSLPTSDVVALLASDKGYPTPKVDVRAVVFDEQRRVLMGRERTDGLWSLPGGWADLEYTPAEVAVKETREETGYDVRALKLLAAFDRSRQGHSPSLFSVYKLFFRCELQGGAPRANLEVSEVGFFAEDDLPPLSTGRVTTRQLARMFAHFDQPHLPTDFE